jgi:hypothetical protein
MCLLFSLALLVACGQKEEAGPSEDTSGAGAPEEMMDTTRMDTAVDTMVDTAAVMEEATEGMEEEEPEGH